MLAVGSIQLANAQVTEASIGLALNELENTAKNILNDANYAFNDVVNNAAVNVLNSIQQFKDAYSDILGKTSNELTIQQQTAFYGLEKNVNNIFYNIREMNDRIDNSVDNLALHLGHTVVGDKIPRITYFSSPSIIRQKDNTILVEFKGVFLNDENNTLLVNGKTIKPDQHTDKELKYLIPTSYFKAYNNKEPKLLFENIEIVCNYKTGWIWKDDKKKNYKYLIKTLPYKLGDIQYEYTVLDEKKETKPRTEKWSFSCKSDYKGKKGKASKSVIVNAEDGWLIDINSVKATWNGNSSCNSSARINVENKSSKAFKVSMNCVTDSKPLVRCNYNGIVTFTQFRTVETDVIKSSDKIPMNSKSQLVYTLPSNTKHWNTVRVKLFNGEELVFTKSAKKGFVKVDFNKVSKVLSIENEK